MYLDLSPTLEARIAQYHSLNSYISAERQEEKRHTTPFTPRHYTTTTTTTPTATITYAMSNNSRFYSSAPMDVSSERRQLMLMQKLRRMHDGLCLLCCQAGHVAMPELLLPALRASRRTSKCLKPLSTRRSKMRSSLTPVSQKMSKSTHAR